MRQRLDKGLKRSTLSENNLELILLHGMAWYVDGTAATQ